ncbi:MAG: 50S ribosomal protein L10 [Candidatus Brockarchaeota archaeon]|nr:50S ribosomal protein L10 [Candidatus Brockarchaeota archaeon]MBO3768406.1 50S ribosomal protein L10 [Candidatus Brockarchaeota archaeon]
MQKVRLSITKKEKRVEELVTLINSYKYVIAIDASSLRTKVINEMRDIFRGRVKFKFEKPSLFMRAAKKTGNKALVELATKYTQGSVLLAFTNEDPFKLSREFVRNALSLPAKAGNIIEEDLVVKPGNTGLPPGPMISELNEVGIPTRIDKGSIWVTKEVVVARAGEKINVKLAAALSKLGLKPIRMYLKPRAALVDDVIVEGTLLVTEPEKIFNELIEANKKYIILAAEISYFTKDTLPLLLAKAHREAQILSLETSIVTEDNIVQLLQIAENKSLLLSKLIDSAQKS